MLSPAKTDNAIEKIQFIFAPANSCYMCLAVRDKTKRNTGGEWPQLCGGRLAKDLASFRSLIFRADFQECVLALEVPAPDSSFTRP